MVVFLGHIRGVKGGVGGSSGVCGDTGGTGGGGVEQGLMGYDYILRGAGVVFRHWPVGSSIT